jgi:hypothetical protein
MKQQWQVEGQDKLKVTALVEIHKDNPFVKRRLRRNLAVDKPKVEKADFWQQMASCLLTTRNRSDADTPVGRFIRTQPFPLGHSVCLERQQDLREHAGKLLTGGIWRANVISDQLVENLDKLERRLWKDTLAALENLRLNQDWATERKTADFIADRFAGFGPKQSRNLLQCLGLTKYEIPIDVRITAWLNEFGFPVRLSPRVLADRDYYCFVLDGIQELCRACDVMPCILDAAIFVDRSKTPWTEENVEGIY